MATTGSGIVAIDKAAVWGTAVDVNGPGKGVYLKNTGVLVATPEELPEEAIGFVFQEYIDNGKKNVALELQADLRFASALWEMICLCIGDDAVAAAGSDFNHVMDLQTTMDGKFHTLAVYDGSVVREVPSFKVSGFTIKGSAAAIVQVTIRGIGNNVIDAGQVNTSLASVTYTTKILRVPFQVQVRINDQVSSALGAGHVVQADDIEISFDRNLTPDFTTNSTLYQTAEPYEVGQPQCKVTLNFPKTPITNYNSGIADLNAGTMKKMDVIFTGPITGNGNNYKITMEFPNVKVSNVESALEGNNQQIPQKITLTPLKAQSAPTGMTGITSPFRLTLLNTTSAAYDT